MILFWTFQPLGLHSFTTSCSVKIVKSPTPIARPLRVFVTYIIWGPTLGSTYRPSASRTATDVPSFWPHHSPVSALSFHSSLQFLQKLKKCWLKDHFSHFLYTFTNRQTHRYVQNKPYHPFHIRIYLSMHTPMSPYASCSSWVAFSFFDAYYRFILHNCVKIWNQHKQNLFTPTMQPPSPSLFVTTVSAESFLRMFGKILHASKRQPPYHPPLSALCYLSPFL